LIDPHDSADRTEDAIPPAAWAALAAVALSIRLYRLDHFSFWLDEVMQSFFIHGTWKQFWASLKFDAVHPPLDYLVDRLFEVFRPGDAARRIPAVVWGTGSVLLLTALMARRAGRTAGMLAGAFLALAPFHVRYSQEFRPYSLGVFLVLLSLVLLDRYLERPGAARLAALYFACLTAMYALYLAALVLAVAGTALAVEDALSSGPSARRSAARRLLGWSPVFSLLLVAGYLPWLPIVREAAMRASPARPPEMTAGRLGHVLAFYGFGSGEGADFGFAEIVYFFLAGAGVVAAIRRPRVRFLAAWVVAGSAAVELLEHLHPHFFGPKHFLPAGVALPAAAALAIAAVGHRNLLRLGACVLAVAGIVAFDARGLQGYFARGRPDWRPLGAYLRAAPADQRILTENAYAQLCVAYFVVGPDWLHRPLPGGKQSGRSIIALGGDPASIAWLWEPGKTAWLVLFGGKASAVKAWAEPYPGIAFPAAEGGAIVKRLDRRR
jgi:4-amino-4-deoxy-L-arabinose transferase-like glycosyltransferase